MENSNIIASEQGIDKITVVNGDTQMTSEVSEEFSLPDYVPEVRKVLTVRASALPEQKYLSDTTLEFSGTVTYSVIYTDDLGNLCAIPLSSTYEAKAQVAPNTEATNITTQIDSVGVRVMAPRKLTLKSRLKNRIISLGVSDISEKITPKSSADELYIERKIEPINTLSIKNAALQNIRISERLEAPKDADLKPIWCDASVVITDVKAQTDAISVRGEVSVKCLCVGNGREEVLSKSFPLSEIVEAEGCQVGDMIKAEARVVSLAISNEESGDKSELFFDVTLEIECEASRNSEVMITRDAYSTKYESEQTYKNLDYYTAIKENNTSFTVNETLKKKDKDIFEIITIIGDPVYEKSEIKGSKINHIGKLLLTVLGKSEPKDDRDSEYVCQSYELPLKLECECGKIGKSAISSCTFALGNISARLDDESITINGEIYAIYSIYDKLTLNMLDSCILKKDNEIKRDSGCVRVCFPKENETLWDVAKKYKISVNKLKEQNDIDNEISNKKCLII